MHYGTKLHVWYCVCLLYAYKNPCIMCFEVLRCAQKREVVLIVIDATNFSFFYVFVLLLFVWFVLFVFSFVCLLVCFVLLFVCFVLFCCVFGGVSFSSSSSLTNRSLRKHIGDPGRTSLEQISQARYQKPMLACLPAIKEKERKREKLEIG